MEKGSAVKTLERPGDGKPVCGLGKAFHAGRRAELRKRLEEGWILVRGLPETRDYTRFHQDKTFWYLTGIESPDATLLMDAASGREILFLPPRNAGKEVWEGELWDSSDQWVVELTGFAELRSSEELSAVLKEVCPKGERIFISMHPSVALAGGHDRAGPADRSMQEDPLDGRTSREAALKQHLEQDFGLRVEDMAKFLSDMRRVKTAEEIDAMRRAGRAGALAMAEAMRSTRPGIGEWELDALMSYIQVREGASGPAYHAIAGSGMNSLTLHYSASTRTMSAGEVILIDYGPEVDHYTTDITRTWPVDGRFSERAAELYDAVLAAQRAGIAAVQPGKTISDVERACSGVFRERGLNGLQRHASCHYIGLEVHDVGSQRAPLVPGVSFTVEPGLYEQETGIGIRIEDVVVVTPDGCEVLTDLVPSEREQVEALVREEGVIDWLVERDLKR